MSLQPGTGYTFTSSGSGYNLDIEQPTFLPPGQDPEAKQLPAQLDVGPVPNVTLPPFQCYITQVNGSRYLQIVTGSMNYSESNMPQIYDGANTHIRQSWTNKVQICPDGMRMDYNDIWPPGYLDPDPNFSNQVMEGGGGYMLSDTNAPILLMAFMWDVGPTPPFNTEIITTGLPTLAIIESTNTTDYNKIAVDSGPSVYEQTMNVQKMAGYTADDFENDWGYCHTTWLNPRKLGYRYQTIATVVATANTFACVFTIEQVGITAVCNTIQRINLIGKASGGGIVFSYYDPLLAQYIPSTIPFPVTDTYTPYYITSSNALALFTSLNAIPQLTGNVQVSGSNGTYFVTFINDLQGTSVAALTANIEGVTTFEYDFEIIQYMNGSIDLTIPMQMGCTKLMNVPEVTEADDPYNVNEQSDWGQIINKDDAINCTGFAGDVTTTGVYAMSGYTNQNPDFYTPDGCIDENTSAYTPTHPFKVIHLSTAAGLSTYEVVPGTVNNEVPGNMTATITVSTGPYEVWLRVPYDVTTTPRIPTPVNFEWNIGTPLPSDTDAEGYVLLATVDGADVVQFITGSLWVDRIKLGTTTARYYFARV